MADSKLSALTALTTFDGDELVYVVDDPSGTPTGKKATVKVLSGWSVIAQTVLGSAAASISFTSIPATFESLRLVASGRASVAGTLDRVDVRFNNDSGSNYDSQVIRGTSTTVSAFQDSAVSFLRIGQFPGSTQTTGRAGSVDLLVPAYARTTLQKTSLAFGGAGTGAPPIYETFAGLWRSTAAINQLDVYCASGNMEAGTVATLYGLRGA